MKMNNSFFETSKVIANQFLQNIVFIDDKAFLQPSSLNHDFDALRISQIFAESQKVCAVYKPSKMADIDNLAELAKKADVTVLDWQINIAQDKVENEEEDALDDDPRGPHTKRIIKSILTDPITGQGSLKLIIIYTGETDLNGITDEVYKELVANDIKAVEKLICQIKTENAKILITAKPDPEGNGEPKFKHTPELNQFVVSYEDLPDFILSKFSEMTSGLLSNFILSSLTVLRNNTFRLINSYSKELDPAFLLHRVLLPRQEDSEDHLIEMCLHSIHALLEYNESNLPLKIENIKDWINIREFNKTIIIANKEFTANNKFITECVEDGFINTIVKSWEGDVSKSKLADITKDFNKLHLNNPDIFYIEGDEGANERFSILSHHKSNFKQESKIPKLSLGTIIQEVRGVRYFLCIQAKCDSTRIDQERKFLFLELAICEENSKFQFIVEDDEGFKRLKIRKDVFDIRTIKFTPHPDFKVILAEIVDHKYIFKSNYDEQFKWLAELGDAHAQRVANNYAAQLSRVGLDESEWLRRWSN